MRKEQIVGGIMIVGLIGYYSWSIQNQYNDIDVSTLSVDSMLRELESLDAMIDTSFAETPEGVMYIYSELLRHQYAEGSTEETIALSVEIMRKLYVEQLRELNDITVQTEKLIEEVKAYKAIGNYMAGSNVVTVTHTQEETANVVIKHVMMHQIVYKEYRLIQQDGRWLIYRWEDIVG